MPPIQNDPRMRVEQIIVGPVVDGTSICEVIMTSPATGAFGFAKWILTRDGAVVDPAFTEPADVTLGDELAGTRVHEDNLAHQSGTRFIDVIDAMTTGSVPSTLPFQLRYLWFKWFGDTQHFERPSRLYYWSDGTIANFPE